MKDIILVTGAAGFIGYHLCDKLLKNNLNVIGIDNLNSYYSIELKNKRINNLNNVCRKDALWKFKKGSLEDKSFLNNIFEEFEPKIVINLAAQAGVRYSLKNPDAYINSNILGFNNLIENSRKNFVKNFIYASSSSIYGGNTKIPFNEKDPVNHPVSLYAATKRSNELVAHSYSDIYGLPCTGLRLFTVYGPWGRPDMAPMIFSNAILSKKPIKIFNNGEMWRDFTFIDDVIEIIYRLINKPAKKDVLFKKDLPNPSSSWAPYLLFNVGNSNKVKLMKFIDLLEKELGMKAIKTFSDIEKGDVQSTFSDSEAIEKWTGFRPQTPIDLGVKKFTEWYKTYYENIKNNN